MTALAADDRQSSIRAQLYALAFFMVPLTSAIFARFSNLGLPLITLSLLIAARRSGLTWKELLVPSAALTAWLALSVYVVVNSSWAANPTNGAIKALVLLGATVTVFAIANAVQRLENWQVDRATVAFVAGATLGALYLLIEMATDGAITRFVMNVFPEIRPDNPKRLKVIDGVVTKVNLSKINQNVTNVAMAVWPALLMLSGLAEGRRRNLWMALFVIVTAGAVYLSEHDSSQIALICSLVVFFIASRWRGLAIRALAAIWCLGFALALPLSFAAYKAELHLSETLPSSYKARLIIWEYTGESTLSNPLLGVGVNTTRDRNSAPGAGDIVHEQPKGHVNPRYTGHHAHSVFLQTWYELGAVGAILFALAGAAAILRIGALPARAQPFAAAALTVFISIAAFAWGMWQTWWMCTAALTAIYLCLGAATLRPRAP